jgi:hypothetical protein
MEASGPIREKRAARFDECTATRQVLSWDWLSGQFFTGPSDR